MSSIGIFTVRSSSAEELTLTYTHRPQAHLILRTSDGQTLRVVITTRSLAGRHWFSRVASNDAMIVGPDFVESTDSENAFIYEHTDVQRPLMITVPFPFTLETERQVRPYNPATQTAVYHTRPLRELPQLPDILASGRIRSDIGESEAEFDDSGWYEWQGRPQTLEDLDVFRGHAWYRAELYLERPLRAWNRGRLYVEHASDIIGIYVNGHYLTTVSPVGTEINSHHRLNDNYRFESAKPYLNVGRNIIAFRTEIWGHGSFMYPRGTLIGTTMQMPSLGYEGLKGLQGKATLAGFPLENWSVRPSLGGQIAGYHDMAYDDSTWEQASMPLQLEAGDVLWYRTSFATEELPLSDDLIAPIVCELGGYNTKATIYLNGNLIGRWLSDEVWLEHGTWLRPQIGMWINNDPDHFPLPRQMLNSDGEPNVLVFVFEDAAESSDDPGFVDLLRLRYNDERYDWIDESSGYRRGVAAHGRVRVELSRM